MTTKKSGGPAIKAGSQYTVQLTRAIKVGTTWLRPGQPRVRVSGTKLKELIDSNAVGSYAEVK